MKINKYHLWVLLGLILLNLGLYFVNLNDFFVSDDFDWLNLTAKVEHLGSYFTTNYYGEHGLGGSYRPMVNVAFWLNFKLWGLNPIPYHLTNLFFHIGVCYLVYLLALFLFAEVKNKQFIASCSAIFFSLLPNHSEAVIWVAAVADPMASFFYLLAFYLYLLFRQRQSFYCLLISVLSFVIALLTKEIAITLPLLIIVWELYQGIVKNKFKAHELILYPFGYWLILGLYFVVRYWAIGVTFGYYASQRFQLNFTAIFKMIASLLTNLLFYGQARIWLTNYGVNNKLFFILLVILLVVLILYYLRKYIYQAAFLVDAYLILVLPVILLSYDNLNDGGERYNYLPTVAFCLLLGLLIGQISKRTWQKIIVSGLVIYWLVFIISKNYDWHRAANLTQQIIQQDLPAQVDLNQPANLLFVSLPDNLSGAQVLRNGIKQAIALYYPQNKVQIQLLSAYILLDRKHLTDKILYWGPYPTGGYLAKSFDQKNWVTGFDRQETEQYIFELWNYDYPTYTANSLRLIFKDESGGFIPAGQENYQIMIFNQGKLQKID